MLSCWSCTDNNNLNFFWHRREKVNLMTQLWGITLRSAVMFMTVCQYIIWPYLDNALLFFHIVTRWILSPPPHPPIILQTHCCSGSPCWMKSHWWVTDKKKKSETTNQTERNPNKGHTHRAIFFPIEKAEPCKYDMKLEHCVFDVVSNNNLFVWNQFHFPLKVWPWRSVAGVLS